MFIMNMSSQELLKEYLSDHPELDSFNTRIDASEYVSRLLNKGRKTGKVCFTKTYTTKHNNTYLNVFVYETKAGSTKHKAKWDWKVYSIGLMQTYKGVSAIMFFQEVGIAILFQSHFFKRYKERLSEICDWKTRELLRRADTLEKIIAMYIQRNDNVTWVDTKSKYDNREHVFVPINDGVLLMQWNGKLAQANTFVTENMLSEQQQEMLDYSQATMELKKAKDELWQTLCDLMTSSQEENNDN